ncbi:DUF2889 domain-containing protein [Aquincola sp. S2]|uniref:DUF2889 domain-containing protein n=1 Tax=Pseudaquabacterium terrae TaxID=2732868 RepID=A0ABX2ETX9_9BURK|nr:DUF2889 domain-containing protein [Aquabacterium terrae]NRF71999.1 DUF2889 domain-containing protein [Aquabacterium terrae]
MTHRAIAYFPLDHYQRPGTYRRRLRIRTGADWARADLEDDPHRYGLTLRHDGTRISAIEGRALRTPWSACGEAVAVLDRLIGMELSPDPQQVYRQVNGRAQCTHLLDLAGLAASHAARGIAQRDYDAEAPCLDPDARRDAVLHTDGRETLRWTLERNAIIAPAPFAGQDLAALMPWAKACIVDRDLFEAVWVLRRALFVSGNRFHDLDAMARATDTGHVLGTCHVYADGVAGRALRAFGSTRDFSDPGVPMLADLEATPGQAAAR